MTEIIKLSKEAKECLEEIHRMENDGIKKDTIKAILLFSEGWDVKKIAQTVLVNLETVYQ